MEAQRRRSFQDCVMSFVHGLEASKIKLNSWPDTRGERFRKKRDTGAEYEGLPPGLRIAV